MARHVRIEIADSALVPRFFADFYHARSHATVRPLLCFWDGAISAREYERRRTTTPDAIVRHWLSAATEVPLRPDLLVFSLPDLEPCTTSVLRHRLRRAFAEVVAASPNPWCSAMGYVGHSAGAYVATCLAFDVQRSRSLATLGGVDMGDALSETPHPPFARLSVATFANAGDPCRDHTFTFVKAAALHRAHVTVQAAPGGHDLRDYAANGSLRAAFVFAAEHLFASRLAVHAD